jgi:hypothetical protein
VLLCGRERVEDQRLGCLHRARERRRAFPALRELRYMGAGATMTDAHEVLASAGWQPSRREDAVDVIATVASHGYDVGPKLALLIANVVGVTLQFMRSAHTDYIVFDPRRATELSFRAWVDDYSERAGTPLVPLGFSNHEHLLLLAADDGRWFGGFDDEFGQLGRSVPELVDTIINNRGFQEVDIEC